MTYSQQVKTEICNVKFVCKNCQRAFIYAMLLFSKTVSNELIILHTESKAVADNFANGIASLTDTIVTIHSPNIRERAKRPMYVVTIENKQDVLKIVKSFGLSDKDDINFSFVNSNCCKLSFLRGAYLTCGAMISPEKEYHLEFSLMNENLSFQLMDMLYEYELDFKLAARNKGYILYIKESQQLEDTLTCLGAGKASMELMNLKIEKELRNKVNRVTNCETANIGKTVNAAMGQIEKIEKIKNIKGLDFLTAELREVATLRIENPDSSLSELCSISQSKISRSGLNHRLKRLCNIADGLEHQS